MSPEAMTGTSTSSTSSAVSEWSASPVYICFAERGWSVSVAAPASTSFGPTSRQVLDPFCRPRRIFTETGSEIASGDRVDDRARAVRVVQAVGAGAGLRHLANRAAEIDVDDVGARVLDHAGGLGHHARLGAEDLHGQRMLIGGDAQVAKGSLVLVGEAGAAHHLGADEPCAEAAALPAECLDADARHRRQNEPRGDLDGPDSPGFAEIYLHRGPIVAADAAFDVLRAS